MAHMSWKDGTQCDFHAPGVLDLHDLEHVLGRDCSLRHMHYIAAHQQKSASTFMPAFLLLK